MIRALLRLGENALPATVKVFRALLEQTRALPGYLACHLYLDLGEPGFLLLEERWQTREGLEGHLPLFDEFFKERRRTLQP
jgi:quinol monooxygenase YgiN